MFLPSFFKSANIKASGNDFSTWISSIGGHSSRAGTQVNTESALALAALRACVTLLAESVAQLPCELYRKDNKGGRERATDHPLYDVIHSQPNKKDTTFEYYEQAQGNLGIEGNHIALIDRDGSGYVKELIPIHPKKVRVLKGQDGLPYYNLLEFNEILPMRMVHHIKAFSLDGFVGLSPIATNADSIGLALATEHHAAAVFQRGATMSGVIERPDTAAPITDVTVEAYATHSASPCCKKA
jgi:HK97 family phage portal protein